MWGSVEVKTYDLAATTTVGTIRSHSPRKMKTQISRQVYNPSTTTAAASSTTNSINRDDVNENETTVIVTADDRYREVKEIQEMLNEITKTSTKQKKETAATVDDPPKVVVAKH
ncbi:uncharacterized protein LOC129918098 [Episyrphus balteatus]|uniref:uncharacterized protein LOC129918098 n=1 Tax=Episyrphus balteatus TaxID=286459 RepID=UPI0024867763|nr:uncharacterized protein LOC129918098 [Episyrphus balteatus]